MNTKSWTVPATDTDAVAHLASEVGCNRLTAAVLIGRGLADAGAAAKYLNPSLTELHPPALLPDIVAGIGRLQQAVTAQEKVLVYGDRDVDGMTSIAVMMGALRRYLPADKLVYTVPSPDEGYGLNVARVRRFANAGVTLVVTVDCGISAVAEVTELAKDNIDVVITDHHEVSSDLPPAVAVIDPKREDSRYPYPMLAGVGVALKVGAALVAAQGDDAAAWRREQLDMVGLGTIADMVPLDGENRVLAWHGLRAMPASERPAMRALCQVVQWPEIPTGRDVAFGIVPLLNSAGRMGQNELGAELFLSESFPAAEELVARLQDLNVQRKDLTKINIGAAEAAMGEQVDLERDRVIVLALEGVAHGVTGIVGSQLKNKYNKPIFVLIIEDGIAQGMGRSVDGWNLLGALEQIADMFERFGGHQQAVGLALAADKVPAFREAINRIAERELPPEPPRREIALDAVIDFADISIPSIADLAKLEPCGRGNPAPRFCSRGVKLVKGSTMGADNSHLRLFLNQSNRSFNMVGWGQGHRNDALMEKDNYDVAFTLDVNRWRGREEPRLMFEDIKPG